MNENDDTKYQKLSDTDKRTFRGIHTELLISKSPCIITAKFFVHAHLSAWNFLSYLTEFQTAIQVQFNCHLL